MEMNINKDIDSSLKISNFGNDANDSERNYEENFQEDMKLINLYVNKKQNQTKDIEESVKEEKNEEGQEDEIEEEQGGEIEEEQEDEIEEEQGDEIEEEQEDEIEEEQEDEIEEEQEDEIEEEQEDEIEEEQEDEIKEEIVDEEEAKNKINYNEKYIANSEKYSSFLKNGSSSDNIFTNEQLAEDYNTGPYEDELINKKQQNYGEGTLFFDKNENEEIIEDNRNTVKNNINNDDVSEYLEKKKKKIEKLNKYKKNLSDNESNEAKSDDTNEKILRKKKKKILRLKKSKYIANAAEEGEEEDEEEPDDELSSGNNINKKKKHVSKRIDYGNIMGNEEEYEMEKDDSNKLQKTKKNYFDQVLENLKFRRKRAPKISEDDGLQYCENVLNQMILVHEQDMKNMKEKKPATSKLQIIDEVCKILTKPKWKPFFMKLNIYHVLALWLMPTSKNTLPNFTIRTNLLKVIQQLPITIKSLRGTQLGKIMTYLHSHRDETKENKKIIRNILQNWMGPIIGINTNYKQFLKERQKKIMENPKFHKKVLEKAKTLIPDSICIEKEEEQNEFKRHATIPYNSECSFLINVPSSIPNSSKRNIPKSKIKRLTDSMKLNKRCRKTQKVSIEGKGVAVAP